MPRAAVIHSHAILKCPQLPASNPLRDRPEDIRPLARHFTKKYADKMNREIVTIPSDTMRALVNWPWPGTVLELENFIERSVILSSGPSLRAPIDELGAIAGEAVGDATLEEIEREHILKVLRHCEGVVTVRPFASDCIGQP